MEDITLIHIMQAIGIATCVFYACWVGHNIHNAKYRLDQLEERNRMLNEAVRELVSGQHKQAVIEARNEILKEIENMEKKDAEVS